MNTWPRSSYSTLQAVATHPVGELSLSIEHDIHQQVNTSSKWSTAESRFIVSKLQVRQLIYKPSVDRWRRYEQYLTSLVSILKLPFHHT